MNSRTLSCRLAGFLLLFALLAPVLAQEPDRIEPFKPIGSAAYILTGKYQGSGVVIDRTDRLLITNNHVVGVGQPAEAIFAMYTDDGQVFTSRELYEKHGKRIRGMCVATSSESDLALLQLESVPQSVAEVKLATTSPKVDDTIYLMGCPGNNKHIWVGGAGSVKFIGELKPTLKQSLIVKAKMMVLTTPDRRMGAGASGGPAVNQQGELVGVIQSGAADSTHLNCVDVSELRKFVGEFFRKVGSAALAKKEYETAVTRCTKAVTFNPADAAAFHERAAAQSFLEHYEQALADYSEAVKIDPKLSRSWRGRASIHYNMGNYAKAVADCTEAIKIDPAYALAYQSRSRAYEKLGQPDQARADREIAVKLDPRLK